MANRYKDLTPAASRLPGVNRYSDGVVSNRYSHLTAPQEEKKPGIFRRTIKSFGGVAGAAGRFLQTGQFAQVGATEKLLEKVGFLKDTDIRGTGVREGIKEEKSNVGLLQRIGRERGGGVLTGQYQPSTSVWTNFAKELPSTTVGIAADIFLDPTFFLGKAGKIKKGTDAISAAVKLGFNKITKSSPAIEQAADLLGRGFINRFKQSEKFIAADKARLLEESLAREDVIRLTTDIIEKPAVIQQRIKQLLKGGITTNDELKKIVEPLRKELDRVGESISGLNPKLLNPDTFQANKGTYFPEMYTKYEFPAANDVVENFFSNSRAVRIARDRFKTRKDIPLEVKKELGVIEEAGFPALKGLSQLRQVEARQKFFNEIASKVASAEPKPGWIQMSDDKALGDLAGKFLSPFEYRAISQMQRVPSEFDRVYQNALSVWKTFKTAYNPATISRNNLTNLFVLNPLGGVGPHRVGLYAKAINEYMTGGPLYQLARKNGLEISTQQAAELTQKASSFYKANRGLVSPFFKNVKSFHNRVLNFYGSQDKVAKMANFIKGVTEDGLSPAQAMKRANFYLVDYSEVPEFIGWLRKQPFGVPFISFTYGVSKPLARTLLERPDKLANYFKILSGIQQMNPMGESELERKSEMGVLPEWIQEGLFLRLPVSDKHGRSQYINLQYIMPFNILESHSLRPSSPAANIIGALFFNRNSFTGQDIVSDSDTAGEKARKQATFILQQIVPALAPFGYSFDKIVDLLKGRPDANGFVRETIPVLIDVLGGLKVTPIDRSLEATKRAAERRREINLLRSELRRILLDKRILPEEKEKERERIQEKINRVE